MRAEILREREKRRAAMKGSMPYGNDGHGERRSGEPTEKRATADPARARVAAAIARLAADRPTDPAAALTLCRIACNACEDAFGDTAPTFANPENAFALATESEKIAAATRVDRRSVKFANAKVREAFFGGEASANEDASGDESPAVDAFVAAGFVLENDAATEVSHDRKDRTSVDARRLTLPYTADVRLVSFLAERIATVAAASPSPRAAAKRRASRRRATAKPARWTRRAACGGRGARALVPPVGGSAAARAQLDDEFFRRDASEVAAEFARAKAAREASSALTTRAWKEKEARMKEEEEEEDKKTKRTDPVTVRVRLPDGTQLLGMFGPREPIGAVRAFVHESLREPFRRFDLAFLGAPLRGDENDVISDANGAKAKPRDSLTGLRTHNVRASSNPNGLTGSVSSKGARVGHKGVGYGEEGTVAGAGLAPSALITFSWAEPARPGENTDGDPRVLNDALSRDAQPLE